MSSCEVSYDPKADWEAKRNTLQRTCKRDLAEIRKGCEGILDEFYNDLVSDILALERMADEIYSKYTWEEFRKSDRYSDFSGELSKKVFAVRQKMSRLQIEQVQVTESVNKSLDITKEILSNEFLSDVLDTYQEEVEELKKEFLRAEKLSSLREKDKSMKALRERLEMLAELHALAKTVDLSGIEEEKSEIHAPKKKIHEDLYRMRREIERFAGLIQDMDRKAYESLKNLLKGIEDETYTQRLKMVRDQVKLMYGKLKEDIALTSTCRGVLIQYRKNIVPHENSDEIVRHVDAMLAKETIARKDFDFVTAQIRAFIQQAELNKETEQRKKEFAGKVEQNLMKLGYVVLSDKDGGTAEKIKQGDAVYLDTQWDDYKIMTRVNERGELITRLVRVVASDDEKNSITSYQKQKDIEVANVWCSDYDRFVEQLKSDGIHLSIKLRREPEEEEVQYVVNKKLAKSKRQKTKKKSGPGFGKKYMQ